MRERKGIPRYANLSAARLATLAHASVVGGTGIAGLLRSQKYRHTVNARIGTVPTYMQLAKASSYSLLPLCLFAILLSGPIYRILGGERCRRLRGPRFSQFLFFFFTSIFLAVRRTPPFPVLRV
ncbi:hypothetical protein GQ53DRAFT_504517 [Thozetella sp. PMI_491]|nr:hypothetical protein GQ53DRAFT_504517 [Thozetella sp. PMI_491]